MFKEANQVLAKGKNPKPTIVKDTQRPFRIWDCHEKCELPHRYYSDEGRALDKALLYAYHELKAGRALEVYDIRKAKVCGVFKRSAEGQIRFHRS